MKQESKTKDSDKDLLIGVLIFFVTLPIAFLVFYHYTAVVLSKYDLWNFKFPQIVEGYIKLFELNFSLAYPIVEFVLALVVFLAANCIAFMFVKKTPYLYFSIISTIYVLLMNTVLPYIYPFNRAIDWHDVVQVVALATSVFFHWLVHSIPNKLIKLTPGGAAH